MSFTLYPYFFFGPQPMPLHTFRFGLNQAGTSISISGEVCITSPEGMPYTQVYAELAEEAARIFKQAMHSRLDPSKQDIRTISETAKNLRAIHGNTYARSWIEGGLDPLKYTITDALNVEEKPLVPQNAGDSRGTD